MELKKKREKRNIWAWHLKQTRLHFDDYFGGAKCGFYLLWVYASFVIDNGRQGLVAITAKLINNLKVSVMYFGHGDYFRFIFQNFFYLNFFYKFGQHSFVALSFYLCQKYTVRTWCSL